MALTSTKTRIRSWARRLGLIPVLSRIRNQLMGGTVEYEAKFSRALLDCIRPGDCVWDVGANLGHYAAQFGDRVGSSGRVVVFEPAPGPFARLLELARPNFVCLNMGLGDRDGVLTLALADDPLGSTHSLVAGKSGSTRVAEVKVLRGDSLVSTGIAPSPNVVKIDVEGFEEEVIRGMSAELSRSACRAVFCEIHFTILENRGERQAPSRIEKELRRIGFRTSWLDSSHLAARR